MHHRSFSAPGHEVPLAIKDFPNIIPGFFERVTIISRLFFLLAAILLLEGCASTSGYRNPKDPFEPFNRSMYTFNDKVDRAVLKPVAQGYHAVVPPGGRTMINNFFSNLNDVVVTLNDVLQLKLKQAVVDGGRVLINTTFGALGLADLAAAGGLEKHNEDFGQTLGYWGIPSGPYLVLPFLGPSSVRDSVGLYGDSLSSATANVRPVSLRNEIFLFNGVRVRANLLDSEKLLGMAALDQYSFLRDAYLSHRQSLVYDGHPPMEQFEDEEDPDSAPPPAPPASPAPAATPEKPAEPAPAITPASAPVAASAVPAADAAPGKQ